MTEAQIGTYSLEVILVESGPTADGVDVEERIKLVVAIIDPTSEREDEILADADADDVFVFNQTFVPKETTVKVVQFVLPPEILAQNEKVKKPTVAKISPGGLFEIVFDPERL